MPKMKTWLPVAGSKGRGARCAPRTPRGNGTSRPGMGKFATMFMCPQKLYKSKWSFQLSKGREIMLGPENIARTNQGDFCKARCLFGACLLASRESSVPDLQLGNLRFMKLSGHLLLGLGYVGTMDLDIVGSWVQCGLRNQSGFRRDHSHGRNLVSKENMAEIKSPKRT